MLLNQVISIFQIFFYVIQRLKGMIEFRKMLNVFISWWETVKI